MTTTNTTTVDISRERASIENQGVTTTYLGKGTKNPEPLWKIEHPTLLDERGLPSCLYLTRAEMVIVSKADKQAILNLFTCDDKAFDKFFKQKPAANEKTAAAAAKLDKDKGKGKGKAAAKQAAKSKPAAKPKPATKAAAKKAHVMPARERATSKTVATKRAAETKRAKQAAAPAKAKSQKASKPASQKASKAAAKGKGKATTARR